MGVVVLFFMSCLLNIKKNSKFASNKLYKYNKYHYGIFAGF